AIIGTWHIRLVAYDRSGLQAAEVRREQRAFFVTKPCAFVHPRVAVQRHGFFLHEPHGILDLVIAALGGHVAPLAHVEFFAAFVHMVLQPEVHRCDAAVPRIGGVVAVAIVAGALQQRCYFRRRGGAGDQISRWVLTFTGRTIWLYRLCNGEYTAYDPKAFPTHADKV